MATTSPRVLRTLDSHDIIWETFGHASSKMIVMLHWPQPENALDVMLQLAMTTCLRARLPDGERFRIEMNNYVSGRLTISITICDAVHDAARSATALRLAFMELRQLGRGDPSAVRLSWMNALRAWVELASSTGVIDLHTSRTLGALGYAWNASTCSMVSLAGDDVATMRDFTSPWISAEEQARQAELVERLTISSLTLLPQSWNERSDDEARALVQRVLDGVGEDVMFPDCEAGTHVSPPSGVVPTQKLPPLLRSGSHSSKSFGVGQLSLFVPVGPPTLSIVQYVHDVLRNKLLRDGDTPLTKWSRDTALTDAFPELPTIDLYIENGSVGLLVSAWVNAVSEEECASQIGKLKAALWHTWTDAAEHSEEDVTDTTRNVFAAVTLGMGFGDFDAAEPPRSSMEWASCVASSRGLYRYINDPDALATACEGITHFFGGPTGFTDLFTTPALVQAVGAATGGGEGKDDGVATGGGEGKDDGVATGDIEAVVHELTVSMDDITSVMEEVGLGDVMAQLTSTFKLDDDVGALEGMGDTISELMSAALFAAVEEEGEKEGNVEKNEP